MARVLRVPVRAVALVAVVALAVAAAGHDVPFVSPTQRQVLAAAETRSRSPIETLVLQHHRVALEPPAHGAYLGFFNPELLTHPNPVHLWDRANGAEARIVAWYQPWFSGSSAFRPEWVRGAERQGAVPMVTWEPWAKPVGGVWDSSQPAARLSLIAEGRYDSYIRAWARGAADYGGPLLMRFMQEMNGFWYPWGVHENGNTPEDFVAAWRHVHDLFQQEGAWNVRWVWSVASFTGLSGGDTDLASFYPGDAYVDWVSVTGFNWGTAKFWNRWHPFDDIFLQTYRALLPFHKPVMISEAGTVTVGGDAGGWISDALAKLPTEYPKVKARVWFDSKYPGGIDFRLSGAESTAFGQAAGASTYWSPDLRLGAARPAPAREPPARS